MKSTTSAQRGDKEAQYQVANTYASPVHKEVERNAATALEWYLKSAKQGYLPAQEQAGRYFQEGWGVEKDLQQALYWYQKAAEQGSKKSSHTLGLMYKDGEGVAADPRKAVQYFEQALPYDDWATASSALVELHKEQFPEEGERLVYWMEYGYTEHQRYGLELIDAYSEGKLVPKNDAKVFYFLNDMYQRDRAYPAQIFQLAALYEEGRGVVRNTAKAEELYKQAAKGEHPDALLRQTLKDNQAALDRGNPQAIFSVALAYVQHKQKNLSADEIDQVILWLEEASNKNHQGARRMLASFYFDELSGHRQDIEKSLAMHEDIARDGDADIQIRLFEYYQDRDSEKALYWLEIAANQGDARAQFGLAHLTMNGALGLEQDLVKAVDWYRASAEQGHPLAMFEMGHMYDHGHGVASDLKEALVWYEKAATAGLTAAMEKVRELK